MCSVNEVSQFSICTWKDEEHGYLVFGEAIAVKAFMENQSYADMTLHSYSSEIKMREGMVLLRDKTPKGTRDYWKHYRVESCLNGLPDYSEEDESELALYVYDVGSHMSHCCQIHGCKYREEDCCVANGEVKQMYVCHDCWEDGIRKLDEMDEFYLEDSDVGKIKHIFKVYDETTQENSDKLLKRILRVMNSSV